MASMVAVATPLLLDAFVPAAVPIVVETAGVIASVGAATTASVGAAATASAVPAVAVKAAVVTSTLLAPAAVVPICIAVGGGAAIMGIGFLAKKLFQDKRKFNQNSTITITRTKTKTETETEKSSAQTTNNSKQSDQKDQTKENDSKESQCKEDEEEEEEKDKDEKGQNQKDNNGNDQRGNGYERQQYDESEDEDSIYEGSGDEDSDFDSEDESIIENDETTEENSEETNITVGTYQQVNKANPQRFSQPWVTEIDHPLPISVFNRLRNAHWQNQSDLPVIQISGIVHRNMRSTGSSEVSQKFRSDLAKVSDKSLVEGFKMIFNDQHTTTIQVRKVLRQIRYPTGFTLRRELKVLHRRQRRLIRQLFRASKITSEEMHDLLAYIHHLAINGRDNAFIDQYPKEMVIPKNYRSMFLNRRMFRNRRMFKK